MNDPVVVGVMAGLVVVLCSYLFKTVLGGRREDSQAQPEQSGKPEPARRARASPALATLVLGEASRQTGIDLMKDAMARQRIGEALEKALEEFERQDWAEINLPFIAADAEGPKHFRMRLRREPSGKIKLDL
jgi:hypothetical protein